MVIPSGRTILVERAYVHVVEHTIVDQVCSGCLSTKIGAEFPDELAGLKLQRCSGCCYVHYCGRACQKADWPVHKLECRLVKNLPDFLKNGQCQVNGYLWEHYPRLMVRIVAALQNDPNGLGDKFCLERDPGVRQRRLTDLMTHDQLLNDKPTQTLIATIALDLKRLAPSSMKLPEHSELFAQMLLIYARLKVNAFNIGTYNGLCLGGGLYLNASQFDHSCAPNAERSWEGTTMVMKLTRPVDSIDDVRVTYVDLMMSREQRRATFNAEFYFTCTCVVCSADGSELPASLDDVSLHDFWALSARCPSADCAGQDNGVLLPVTQPKDKRHYDGIRLRACLRCGRQVDDEFLKRYAEALRAAEVDFEQYVDGAHEWASNVTDWPRSLSILYKSYEQHRAILGDRNVFVAKLADRFAAFAGFCSDADLIVELLPRLHLGYQTYGMLSGEQFAALLYRYGRLLTKYCANGSLDDGQSLSGQLALRCFEQAHHVAGRVLRPSHSLFKHIQTALQQFTAN